LNSKKLVRRRDARVPGGARSTPLDDWAVAHPFFNTILQWLLQRILLLSDPSVFLIVGPTGVGKSTMIVQLLRELARCLAEEVTKRPGTVAAVSAEATYIPGRGLDWKSMFEDLLTSADDILIDQKVEEEPGERKGTLRALERATTAMLIHRAPAVAIIDEGSAFLESQSSDSLLKSLRYLKSLANKSRTHLAIFGDYRLARMVEWDGQLNRRCHLAHFPGYAGDAGKTNFAPVVEKFEQKFRAAGVPCELMGELDLLFEKSCGCVGLLRKWILEAYVESTIQQKALNAEVLRACAFPEKAVTKWKLEINDGMANLLDYVGNVRCDPLEGKK
jgi:hypothetical protein